MVLEHTPVKRLLAEQLAVPPPQLSLFLLPLLSTPVPLWGISPCVRWVWGGSAPCDTRGRVCLMLSYFCMCEAESADISFSLPLLRPVVWHQLCSPLRPQSHWSHPPPSPNNVYTSYMPANKERFQFGLFFTEWGTGVGRVIKCPNTG